MEETQIVKQEETFSVRLASELDNITTALPKDFNKTRFVQNALSLLNDNPNIAKYNKSQIIGGLLKGAVLGLDFYNKECYLIPYGNQLNYQTDYRGAKKLVKKYSIRPVIDVDCKIVRDGDSLDIVNENGNEKFTFKQIPFNNSHIIGAFAYVTYADGTTRVDMMSLDELENTRKHSKASNSMAWRDFTTEMYRKTVIHRLCKYVDLEFENQQQKDIFDEDMEIETDEAKIVENEINQNANSVDFVEFNEET